MSNVTPPYADPGRASFEQLDTYLQNFLLAGHDPELKPAYSFPVPNNVDYKQFTVVGLNADGDLVPATNGGAAAAASGTLTFSGVGTANDTVTIGNVTYKLVAAPAAANEVKIGAAAADTAANIAAAINGGAGEGTLYGTGPDPHPQVSASVNSAVVTVTARQTGDGGNGVATTESGTGTAFASATLTGGRDAGAGGVQALGVLAHAVTLGSTGSANGQAWYSGCFNQDALVWDASFDTDASKQAAFRGAPTPTTIIVAKRG